MQGSRTGEHRVDLRRLDGPAHDVARALHDLAKTARSFGFYARDNQTISRFLEELEGRFTDVLDAVGAVRLDVGADRFVWQGQAVYHDADREKGLPFRLFRDGIRRLVFKPGLDRTELLTLLDALSRRQSTGRSAEEDDVVTLLWKLSLNHVSYEAVEGFTHELHGDSEEGGGGEALPRILERIGGEREALAPGHGARSWNPEPEEIDLVDASGLEATATSTYAGVPHYLLPSAPPGQMRPAAIARSELAGLRAELAQETRLGVPTLLEYCFELAARERGFFGVHDFAEMVGAMRRALLRDHDLESYARMVRTLRRIRDGDLHPPDLAGQADALLAGCATAEALAPLVASASGERRREDLAFDVLQVLGGHVRGRDLFELLCHGMTEHMAGILAASIVARVGLETGVFADGLLLDAEQPDVPRALAALRCLGTLGTPEAASIVEEALLWPAVPVRRAAVRILGKVSLAPSSPAAFGRALRDPEPSVWGEALASIWSQGRPELAPVLADWLDERAFKLDEGLRLEVATLVSDLAPAFATDWYSGRLRVGVRARMGGLVGTPEFIAWNRLAAYGLAQAATPEAIEHLRRVRTRGDDDFEDHVTAMLVVATRKARG